MPGHPRQPWKKLLKETFGDRWRSLASTAIWVIVEKALLNDIFNRLTDLLWSITFHLKKESRDCRNKKKKDERPEYEKDASRLEKEAERQPEFSRIIGNLQGVEDMAKYA